MINELIMGLGICEARDFDSEDERLSAEFTLIFLGIIYKPLPA
jgi:hypothetical protein